VLISFSSPRARNTGIDTNSLHDHIRLSLIIKNTLLTGNNPSARVYVGTPVKRLGE